MNNALPLKKYKPLPIKKDPSRATAMLNVPVKNSKDKSDQKVERKDEKVERKNDERKEKGDQKERERNREKEDRRERNNDRDKERDKDKDKDKERDREYDRNKERDDQDKEREYDDRNRNKDDDRFKDDRDRRDKDDDYEDKDEKFMFTKLKDLLIENKNKILRLYSEDGYYKFIEIISLIDGEKILIYIPSKFPIPISLEYPYIELASIDLNEDFDKELDKINPSSAELKDYGEIKLLSKHKNINISDDELLDQLNNYSSVDLEREYLKNVKDSIKIFDSQLERFEKTTSKIKYKFGILNSRILSIINRHNEIQHYIFKQPIKSINKELVIVLDLESYYNKLDLHDDINIDIRKIYMNIFTSFSSIHSKENNEAEIKLNNILKLVEKLPKQYDEQQNYLSLLNEITSKFVKYNEEEKVLQDKLLKVRFSDETDVSRSFQIGKLEAEIEKLEKVRDEAIYLYREMKNKYTEIMLNYDHVLYDNLNLLNKINSNFKMLKL